MGPRFEAGDNRRRADEIRNSPVWAEAAEIAKSPAELNRVEWLVDSAEFWKTHVYAPEIMKVVEQAATDEKPMPTVNLSELYLKSAGAVARMRAVLAARRWLRYSLTIPTSDGHLLEWTQTAWASFSLNGTKTGMYDAGDGVRLASHFLNLLNVI